MAGTLTRTFFCALVIKYDTEYGPRKNNLDIHSLLSRTRLSARCALSHLLLLAAVSCPQRDLLYMIII